MYAIFAIDACIENNLSRPAPVPVFSQPVGECHDEGVNHSSATGLPLLSLKGCNNKAQGIALGHDA